MSDPLQTPQHIPANQRNLGASEISSVIERNNALVVDYLSRYYVSQSPQYVRSVYLLIRSTKCRKRILYKSMHSISNSIIMIKIQQLVQRRNVPCCRLYPKKNCVLDAVQGSTHMLTCHVQVDTHISMKRITGKLAMSFLSMQNMGRQTSPW